LTRRPRFGILTTLSLCHLLNDMVQSLLVAIYPLLKAAFDLSFAQIGLITMANMLTASVLQPIVGLYTDRRPQPFSLAVGMGFTLAGVLTLSIAHSFPMVLGAAGFIGLGSSIFHPESSRIARLACGGQHGFAQSFFQFGGNAGSALGPLFAAFVVAFYGQSSIAWMTVLVVAGLASLWRVGEWYRQHSIETAKRPTPPSAGAMVSPRESRTAIAILLALIFSKYVYLASLSSYYTFYLISRFHVSVRSAQLHLFVFLGAVAAGTIIGGPIGDRIGRRRVILWSILGVLPFTLVLPYVNLIWTDVLALAIGLILASAFSAIVVYAQELIPGRVGMIAGLFFGVAFGIAAVGAALLGRLADRTNIFFVYQVCAFLPLIGALAFRLPRIEAQDNA